MEIKDTCSYAALIVDNRSNTDINISIEEHMKFLPEEWECIHYTDFTYSNLQDYNNLLVSKEFWQHFIEIERVLIFQHDSRLLRTGIEEFLKFDYCGAPISGTECFNGGLSLRNSKMMLRVIEEIPYDGKTNEDMYFSDGVRRLGGILPTFEEAQRFSIETHFGLGSLGYHAIDRHLSKEQCESIRNQYEEKTNL